MNEIMNEILKDINYLINLIWNKKSNKTKYKTLYWIKSHIGKTINSCNLEELKILRYLLAIKAKTGECPIEEHRDNTQTRRRQVLTGWKDIRQEILNKAKGRCCLCSEASELTIDHIQPIFLGGRSNLDNLRALCKSCHKAKSQKEAIISTLIFRRDKLKTNIYLAKKYYYSYVYGKKSRAQKSL